MPDFLHFFALFVRPPSGNNLSIGIPESKRILMRMSRSTPLAKSSFSLFNVLQKYCAQVEVVKGIEFC